MNETQIIHVIPDEERLSDCCGALIEDGGWCSACHEAAVVCVECGTPTSDSHDGYCEDMGNPLCSTKCKTNYVLAG